VIEGRATVKIGRKRGGARRGAVLGIALALAAATGTVAATPLDFGGVNVGTSATTNRVVPLTAALSELDPATVLYAGGNPTIDFLLPFYGLSAPVTAGSLFGAIGEVTATYHVDLSIVGSTDFTIDDGDCLTASGSCSAGITFQPSGTGPIAATVTASILDLEVDSSDELLAAMASFMGNAVQVSLDFPVSGLGVPNTGSVGATVTVPASAACLELSTSAIDFGTLPLGTVDAPATPDITVTNCSGSSESIYASATDASGPNALWTLTDAAASCADTLGLDAYRLRLAGGGTPVELSTVNKSLGSVGAGLGSTQTARIDLACPGSTGAGTTMTFQITFLATAEG
jgi:hypothetical protein